MQRYSQERVTLIYFSTNVDPVRIYVDGLNVGATPISVDVEKKVGRGRLVRFEKPGYVTQEFNLKNKFDKIALLDISSVVVSGGIDVLTGAIMEYSPTEYHVEMFKEGQEVLGNDSKKIRFVSFVLTNSEEIKQNLVADGGEALDALLQLTNSRQSSLKFSQWLTNNKQLILSASSPEILLARLRSSGMTP